ncbi:MAG: S53 family peptidase, partial [Mycobacterium sp.]
MTPPSRRTVLATLLTLVVAAGLLVANDRGEFFSPSARIGGPYGALLAGSSDLGPARGDHVEVTAELRSATRPDLLFGWAGRNELTVRWRPGDAWAVVEGEPAALAAALDVDVHDYRGRLGQDFYASPQQPAVPAPVHADVAALGRILSYTPHRESRPPIPAEVPEQGLSPDALMRTYNAMPMREAGHTGNGVT